MHKFINTLNKLFLLIFFFLFTLTLASCKKNTSNYLDDAIAIAYQNNIAYLVNEKNERFSLEKYDSIVPFFDETIIVKKNNLFGYIKKTGEVLLEPQYDEAYPFSEGKAVVRKNGASFIIDQTGKKLYQFERNYTSIGHFVNNRLVISNSSSQGYLVYNPDTLEFNYLYNIPQTNELGQNTITHFPYDYCGQFSDECAVVGYVNENGDYKYSHINLNGERLYDKEWDYASDFSEGYAVVGNNITYTLRVYLSKEGTFDDEYRLEHNRYPLTESQKPKIVNMSYMYISKTGRYLGKEIIDPITNETTIDPYVFSNACSFKDSIAIVSNLCLLSESFKYYGYSNFSTDNLFSNYQVLDSNGNFILETPMYNRNYWGKGIVTSYTDIIYTDQIYILSYCAREYQTLYFNHLENANELFMNVPVRIAEDEYWIDDYIQNFTNGLVEPQYVIDHATPYNQSLFKKSPFTNCYVAKTQISSGFKDSCGLIKLNVEENTPYITYVIPPIYDNIIF